MKIFIHEDLNRIDVLDERFYTLDNKTFFPSVTTVLSVYPKGWGYNDWLKSNGYNADILLQRAGERGTNVHDAIERFLIGEEITFINKDGRENHTLDEWQMICRFMEFYERTVDPGSEMGIETMLFSKKMRLGGTADLVCKINGETWLIDYKTSNALYKTHEVQLAVYKDMWDEVNTPKIDRYGVLWLNAKTRTDKEFQGKGWQLKEFTKNHDHNRKLYDHTRALWDEENPTYVPANKSFPNSFKKEKE